MTGGSGIAVVIPAFNEAATLGDIVHRATALTDKVWVVDDGSTDKTPDILSQLPCRALRHSANAGKGASLRSGISAALEDNPEAVITLDADGQHPPEAIADLEAHYQQTGEDLIIAARVRDRQSMPPVRRFGNNFADFWLGLAGNRRVHDSQSGFRLYSADLLRALPIGAVPGDRFDFEGRLLIEACRQGFATGEIPIAASYPPSAMSSHYRPVWDTAKIVGMVAKRILSETLSTCLAIGGKGRKGLSSKKARPDRSGQFPRRG